MKPSFDPDLVRHRLEDVRQRTLALVAPLDWQGLRRQHISILSPMVWDLGHIGMFEEMWLRTRLGGGEPLHPEYGQMFDPVANPRNVRDGLELPERSVLFDYLNQVREAALDRLAEIASGRAALDGAAPLADDGFVYELVAEHEEQHQETLLQAMQLMTEPRSYTPGLRRSLPPGGPVPDEMISIPSGAFRMGHSGPGFAYDNEKEAHEAYLPEFRIDPAPVTCLEYLAFVEDGGYDRRELWSDSGWAYKEEDGLSHPRYWIPPADGHGWRVRHFDRIQPLPERQPALHVTYWEAEAYARFVGKRLPTEAEWEKAALWDPERQEHRPYPWGHEPPSPKRANLDQLGFGPADVGAYPEGVSAYGVHQMVGDVWEWTSSDFRAYPNFRPFPYREYSEIFFGSEYKVLRGGSWATRPAVARGTFRNWDFPIRSQIFTGIRCVEDPA